MTGTQRRMTYSDTRCKGNLDQQEIMDKSDTESNTFHYRPAQFKPPQSNEMKSPLMLFCSFFPMAWLAKRMLNCMNSSYSRGLILPVTRTEFVRFLGIKMMLLLYSSVSEHEFWKPSGLGENFLPDHLHFRHLITYSRFCYISRCLCPEESGYWAPEFSAELLSRFVNAMNLKIQKNFISSSFLRVIIGFTGKQHSRDCVKYAALKCSETNIICAVNMCIPQVLPISRIVKQSNRLLDWAQRLHRLQTISDRQEDATEQESKLFSHTQPFKPSFQSTDIKRHRQSAENGVKQSHSNNQYKSSDTRQQSHVIVPSTSIYHEDGNIVHVKFLDHQHLESHVDSMLAKSMSIQAVKEKSNSDPKHKEPKKSVPIQDEPPETLNDSFQISKESLQMVVVPDRIPSHELVRFLLQSSSISTSADNFTVILDGDLGSIEALSAIQDLGVHGITKIDKPWNHWSKDFSFSEIKSHLREKPPGSFIFQKLQGDKPLNVLALRGWNRIIFFGTTLPKAGDSTVIPRFICQQGPPYRVSMQSRNQAAEPLCSPSVDGSLQVPMLMSVYHRVMTKSRPLDQFDLEPREKFMHSKEQSSSQFARHQLHEQNDTEQCQEPPFDKISGVQYSSHVRFWHSPNQQFQSPPLPPPHASFDEQQDRHVHTNEFRQRHLGFDETFSLHLQCRTAEWWEQQLLFLVDLAVSNAFHAYNHTTHHHCSQTDKRKFIRQLAFELISPDPFMNSTLAAELFGTANCETVGHSQFRDVSIPALHDCDSNPGTSIGNIAHTRNDCLSPDQSSHAALHVLQMIPLYSTFDRKSKTWKKTLKDKYPQRLCSICGKRTRYFCAACPPEALCKLGNCLIQHCAKLS